MKKQLPARVDEEIQNSLKQEAKTENRTFSNHVETVLKKHVEKQEVSKHKSKKELGND